MKGFYPIGQEVEQIRNTSLYKLFEKEFESRGVISHTHKGKPYNFFSLELYFFLLKQEDPIELMDTEFGRLDQVSLKKYLEVFLKHYDKGQHFFRDRFPIQNYLYSNNEKALRRFAKDIREGCFNSLLKEYEIYGWKNAVHRQMIILNYKQICFQGFYSGVYSEVVEFNDAHPSFFKEYGDFELTKNKDYESENNKSTFLSHETTELENEIKEQFNNAGSKKKWEYFFRKEDDFNYFIELLLEYFTDKANFELPQRIIDTQKNCKTKLGSLLGDIYKLDKSNDILKHDQKYLQIAKITSAFEESNHNDIYVAMGKSVT